MLLSDTPGADACSTAVAMFSWQRQPLVCTGNIETTRTVTLLVLIYASPFLASPNPKHGPGPLGCPFRRRGCRAKTLSLIGTLGVTQD